MSSVCELWFLIKNIEFYEPELINIIKYYMNTYTFGTNEELKDAVCLWNANRYKALKQYGHISYWDVSLITYMNELFTPFTSGLFDTSLPLPEYNSFNDDISRWDVSNVISMDSMFRYTNKFNQPIGCWDVSSVTNMGHMFCGAIAFNQDISKWDVSFVTNTCEMFKDSIKFNQDISKWNIINLKICYKMFYNCSSLTDENKNKINFTFQNKFNKNIYSVIF